MLSLASARAPEQESAFETAPSVQFRRNISSPANASTEKRPQLADRPRQTSPLDPRSPAAVRQPQGISRLIESAGSGTGTDQHLHQLAAHLVSEARDASLRASATIHAFDLPLAALHSDMSLNPVREGRWRTANLPAHSPVGDAGTPAANPAASGLETSSSQLAFAGTGQSQGRHLLSPSAPPAEESGASGDEDYGFEADARRLPTFNEQWLRRAADPQSTGPKFGDPPLQPWSSATGQPSQEEIDAIFEGRRTVVAAGDDIRHVAQGNSSNNPSIVQPRLAGQRPTMPGAFNPLVTETDEDTGDSQPAWHRVK